MKADTIVKIPKNFVYMIEQLDNNIETEYFFVIFSPTTELSYVIDISKTKTQGLPTSLSGPVSFQ